MIPADRGATGLGLIMQLAGAVFAIASATAGGVYVVQAGGPASLAPWVVALAGAGAIRSLLHRAAGVALGDGRRPLAAFARYAIAAAVHTIAWVVFLIAGLDAPAEACVAVVAMLVAWPATLALFFASPALRPVEAPEGGADRGLESLGALMVVLGVWGVIYALAFLAGASSGTFPDPTLAIALQLALAVLAARSMVHVAAGAALVARRSVTATRWYVRAGVATALLGSIVIVVGASVAPSAISVGVVGAAIVLGLLAWPLTVHRFLRRRDVGGELAPAVDRGRTALGWLLVGFGAHDLATNVPEGLGLPFAVEHPAVDVVLLLGMRDGSTGSPWVDTVESAAYLVAGAALVLMVRWHRPVATVLLIAAAGFGVHETLGDHDHDLGRIVAVTGVVVPLAIAALLQRRLPPPQREAVRVFE